MPTVAEIIEMILGVVDYFGVVNVILALIIIAAAITVIQRATDKG